MNYPDPDDIQRDEFGMPDYITGDEQYDAMKDEDSCNE